MPKTTKTTERAPDRVTPEEAREEAKHDAPRVGDPDPSFGQLMPAEGGSYIREGRTLRRRQHPTAVPETAPVDEDARKRAAENEGPKK